MKQSIVIDFFINLGAKAEFDDFKYVIKMNGGNSAMEVVGYKVADGIELVLFDMNPTEVNKMNNFKMNDRIIAIDYCITGQFECLFEDNSYLFLSDRDVSLYPVNKKKIRSQFYKNRYKGVGAYIDVDVAGDVLVDFFNDERLKLDRLYDYLNDADRNLVINKPERFEYIFKTILEADGSYLREFYHLNIMALLLKSCELMNHDEEHISRYYSAINADKVQSVREYIHRHYAKRLTIDLLAERFDIPSATLRTLFKSRYKDTIYHYIKKTRVQRAKKLIIKTPKKIIDIALDVGYENPGKFSAAFKDITGTTPLKYRRDFSVSLSE